jgi:hypothetical protein
MSTEALTRQIVWQVRAAASALDKIVWGLLDARHAAQDEAARGADPLELAEFARIQRNLLDDIGVIGKHLAAAAATGDMEEWKEARWQAGLLLARCDVTIQSAPLTVWRGIEETEEKIRRLQAQVDEHRRAHEEALKCPPSKVNPEEAAAAHLENERLKKLLAERPTEPGTADPTAPN